MHMTLDNKIDRWRFEYGVPDEPMFIAEMSKYNLYNPSKVNLKDGDVLRLVRNPSNVDDPNAVEVRKTDDNMFIGYLPRELAAILSPALKKGVQMTPRFHVRSDVASGMIVISGPDLSPLLPKIEALSQSGVMNTGLHVKASTDDLNIEWYNQNAALYDYNANRCNPRNDMSSFLSSLRPGAKILDAGCGNGRDVETMLNAGFDVHAFDASVEMCKITEARTKGRVTPRLMSFSDYDDPIETWDGIWAMASLVHTKTEDLPDIVGKLQRSLKPAGVLFAALKYGDGNELLEDGRIMTRISEDMLRECFSPLENCQTRVVHAKNSLGQMDTWINVMFMNPPEPELRMEI